MSKEKERPTWLRSLELMYAVMMGVFASKLFEPYWNVRGLLPQLIVGIPIVIEIFLFSFIFVGFIEIFESIWKRRKRKQKKQS